VLQLLAGDGGVLPLTASDVEAMDSALAAALSVAGVWAGDVIVPLSPHRGIAVAAARLGAQLVVAAHGDPAAAAAATGATVVFATAHADVRAFRERLEALGGGATIRFVAGTASDAAGWPHRPFLGRPETGVVAASCGHGDWLHVLDAAGTAHVDGETLDGPCPCGRALPRLRLT
jgi:hypothetical protein